MKEETARREKWRKRINERDKQREIEWRCNSERIEEEPKNGEKEECQKVRKEWQETKKREKLGKRMN